MKTKSHGQTRGECLSGRQREGGGAMIMAPKGSVQSPSPSLAKDLSQFSSRNSSAGFKSWRNFKTRIKKFGSGKVTMSSDNDQVTIGVSPGARPEHLVILVNGIVGSADNWRFAAEQFKMKLKDKVVIHCSASNSALKTFHGVDVMGHRLAEEVQDVIRETSGVTKISFLAHSLGGLVARYAIGQLYRPPHESSIREKKCSKSAGEDTVASVHQQGKCARPCHDNISEATSTSYGTIAGLEPANFITVATPHLGSRGSWQLPFLLGFPPFEKVAPLMAHWFVGRTGRHLFLTDGDLPLLRRMVDDCDEGKFISALRAFQQRTTYANVMYDHMVGWRTSSLRRASEMPEIRHEPVNPTYPHIVREEELPPCLQQSSITASEFGRAGGRNFNVFEEEMVVGLQQVPWRRVDVSFVGASTSRFMAHNVIQVKIPLIHGEGKDVIHHILDKHF